MKTYIAILIGIVVLFGVVSVGYKFTSNKSHIATSQSQTKAKMMKVSGDVKRVYEGDHVISYSFDIPEVASTTNDLDGALIRVIGSTGTQATVYFSYEGARGYAPLDYLTNVVAPHVAVIDPTGTSTIGGYEWTTAESNGSEWYISPSTDKQWLIVIEAKKTSHEDTADLLTSLTVK
jgi:hypothetical protein